MDELRAAALRYKLAVEALHSIHSTTDVHGRGGIAGQAFTPHCAYICGDTGNRVVVNEDRSLQVVEGVAPHEEVLREYEEALNSLEELLSA